MRMLKTTSLMICSTLFLTSCETFHPEPMDILMTPITLPAALAETALLIPSIPFAIAYEISKPAIYGDAYNSEHNNYNTSHDYASAQSYKSIKSGVQPGQRVWRND